MPASHFVRPGSGTPRPLQAGWPTSCRHSCCSEDCRGEGEGWKGSHQRGLGCEDIALQGVEDSPLRRLDHVRSQKEKNKEKKKDHVDTSHDKDGTLKKEPSQKATGRGAKPKSRVTYTLATVSSSSDDGTAPMDEETKKKNFPKKLAKRENDRPAQEQEQKTKEGSPHSSDKDWAKVTP